VVQEIARELAGRGAVVQVNTQENPQLAGRFNVTGIPTVMILKGEKVLDRISGAMDRNALLAWWKRHVP
jgi:thioredoxin 2